MFNCSIVKKRMTTSNYASTLRQLEQHCHQHAACPQSPAESPAIGCCIPVEIPVQSGFDMTLLKNWGNPQSPDADGACPLTLFTGKIVKKAASCCPLAGRGGGLSALEIWGAVEP